MCEVVKSLMCFSQNTENAKGRRGASSEIYREYKKEQKQKKPNQITRNKSWFNAGSLSKLQEQSYVSLQTWLWSTWYQVSHQSQPFSCTSFSLWFKPLQCKSNLKETNKLQHLQLFDMFFWFCFVKVKITPEVNSSKTRRAVIYELVRLHKNTDLADRLPVYDGGINLYTAGLLPFVFKEFTVTLLEDDYVTR